MTVAVPLETAGTGVVIHPFIGIGDHKQAGAIDRQVGGAAGVFQYTGVPLGVDPVQRHPAPDLKLGLTQG